MRDEYTRQADLFLEKCNTKMDIAPVGMLVPIWDTKPHMAYDCKITTDRGAMTVRFYDSTHNTEYLSMTPKEFYQKMTRAKYDCATYSEKTKYANMLEEKKKECVPTPYDILACLQKYDVGGMDDFMREYGYEIKCVDDMTNFIATYNAVVKEYSDVKRCFSDEQIDMLQEIC